MFVMRESSSLESEGRRIHITYIRNRMRESSSLESDWSERESV